jgi:hypothetical protein
MLKVRYSFIVPWRYFTRVCYIEFNGKIIANDDVEESGNGALYALSQG